MQAYTVTARFCYGFSIEYLDYGANIVLLLRKSTLSLR